MAHPNKNPIQQPRRSNAAPKRAHTTLKQKMMIINFIKHHPSWDQATVAKHFQKNGFPTLSQSTISRYIKDEERYRSLALDPSKWDVKKQKPSQSPQILSCMEFWFYQSLGSGNDPYLHLNLDLLKQKWREFEAHLVMRQKKQSSLIQSFEAFTQLPKRFRPPLHSNRTSPIDYAAEMDRIWKITDQYQLEDILAMDEIGLAYSCPPSEPASLCSLPKLTLALTCSADGSWKDTPLIIGQTSMSAAYPSDQASDDCGFSYHWNTKAVMTCAIWEKYLADLDEKSRQRGHKVLLLVDTTHVHLLPDPPLSNVQLEFIDTAKIFGCDPSNLPCHPFAAGITKYFKSEYRVRFCLRALSSDEFGLLDLYNLDQAAATRIIQDAWNCMTPGAITSTFRRSGVISHRSDDQDCRYGELNDAVYEDGSPIEDPAIEQSVASLTMCLTQLTIKVMNLSEKTAENRDHTPAPVNLDPNINPALTAQSVPIPKVGPPKPAERRKRTKKPEDQIVNVHEFIDIDHSLPTQVLWDEQDIVDQILRESREALISVTSSMSTHALDSLNLSTMQDWNLSDEASGSPNKRSASAMTEDGDILVAGEEPSPVRRRYSGEEDEGTDGYHPSMQMYGQPIRSSPASMNHHHLRHSHAHYHPDHHHQQQQQQQQQQDYCNELSNFSQQISSLESVRKFCLDLIAKNQVVDDDEGEEAGGRMVARSSIVRRCLPLLVELEDEFKALEAADLLRLVSG